MPLFYYIPGLLLLYYTCDTVIAITTLYTLHICVDTFILHCVPYNSPLYILHCYLTPFFYYSITFYCMRTFYATTFSHTVLCYYYNNSTGYFCCAVPLFHWLYTFVLLLPLPLHILPILVLLLVHLLSFISAWRLGAFACIYLDLSFHLLLSIF